MKSSNFSNIICSVFLAIAFMVGCFIISGGQLSSSSNKTYKPLMSIQETADYLNISESQVKAIISSEEKALTTSGSYRGKMLPIIKIGNDIFVSSAGLSEWIKESTEQRKQYEPSVLN
ncbi:MULTISPECIES: helix-turn-helix domain-containing protein [Paenibacillus]|uniref:helix-turn-helix domain-containing protein n=1 Tax=Paenibacillus TaxID=44249 RepID=UPI0022B91CD5|nr:helix-turn-helix domain-containing protein [Paenibacillus caseinilyticus]MCZ8517859.1 helix-turn-helix domain-containing protein [Paenibacillus caseinilyticus]